jgi:glycosyltransferase involved in cell wall biosynthesis
LSTHLLSIAKILINNQFFGIPLESFLARLKTALKAINPFAKWKVSSEIKDLSRRIQNEEFPAAIKDEKIIVVISRFFMQNQISGVNFTLAILSFALVRRGFKVIVLTESNRFWEKKEEVNGLTIIGIPNSLIYSERDLPAYYGTWSRAVAETISKIKNENDIVTISTLAGLEGYATLKTNPDVKQVVYLVTDHLIHNGQMDPGPAKTPRLEKLKQAEISYLGNHSVETVGDSDVIIRDLAHVLELESLSIKSSTIRIGIPWNYGDNKPLFDERYVLYVGSVSQRKGVGTLLSAWSEIHAHAAMESYKLIICGPVGDDSISENRIAENATNQRIHRIIGATENMKGTLLRHAALVVIPSNYESFGMVAVEAMQFGKKIIASRIGGLPEVLGQCASFIEPGDHEGLAKSIVSSISSPDIDDSDKVAARAKHFSVAKMCLEFEQVFIN